MSRWGTVSALLLLVVGCAALMMDYNVARWMEGGHLRKALSGDIYGAVRLSEAFAHGIVVLLIILLIARVDGRGWRILPFLAASSLGSGIAANTCKLLISRIRPCQHEFSGSVLDSFRTWFPSDWNHDLQSFPSAHAAVAFGFAVALTRLYPRGRPLFMLFALLAGLQRVESGAHYVSDVLVGAAIGVAIATSTPVRCFLPHFRRSVPPS
jgi:undecaprenyl-diphosphatase